MAHVPSFRPVTPDNKKSSNSRGIVFTTSPTGGFTSSSNGLSPPPTMPSLNTNLIGFSRVQGIFKAFTSDNNDHASNPFIPENVTQEKLMVKHSDAMHEMRIPTEELRDIIQDSYYFHHIQQQLRDRQAQTDGMAMQQGPMLLRECLTEYRMNRANAIRNKVQMDRENKIKRELTEARIKAQQALRKTKGTDDEETEETENMHPGPMLSPILMRRKSGDNIMENDSPTSVINALSLSDEQLVAFKPGLEAEISSEDGDIQELIDDDMEY